MRLKGEDGRVGIFKTNCKAWGCLGCRERKKALLVDRIEYGAALIVEPLYFITVTFLTEGSSRRDALSVEKAFRRWCELMRLSYPRLTWFKSVEWTKKRQAHLHLIVGGMKEEVNRTCVRQRSIRGKVLSKPCRLREECLEHKISRMWLNASKDSFIVSCGNVVGPKGIAGYMAKYVTKEVFIWEDMKGAGFKRRWSCSRNWPRYEKLELAGTRDDAWAQTRWSERGDEYEYYGKSPEDGSFKKVGSDRAVVFAEKVAARRRYQIAKRIKNASDNQASRYSIGGR